MNNLRLISFFLVFAFINCLAQDSISNDSLIISPLEGEMEGALPPEGESEGALPPEGESEGAVPGPTLDYFPWNIATLQGKLKMKGLPVSPSLKIFMKKDSLISISITAPFIGEAGRLTVTPDSVTAVNKLNKTYCNEGIADFLKYYPGGFGNVQDLLLARVFIPGFDIMEDDIEELFDVTYENYQYNLIPKGPALIDGIKYGYVIDENFFPLMLLIMPESRPDVQIAAFYRYNLKGYDLQLVLQQGEEYKDVTLEFKEPQWDGTPPKEINLNKKFKCLSLGEFLRAF